MLDFSDLAVPTPTPGVKPIETPKDNLDFSDIGGQVVTPEEQKQLRERAEYTTTGATVKAGAAGVARGLTLGLSDLILKGVGYGEEAAKLQAYQPGISTAGEVLGTIGGAFLGPGALVAKGATAATKGIGSTLGRVAAKEAIEGATYGIGQTISEQALGSSDSIGESLVANVGLGSMLGAGFGVGAHGISEGAQALSGQVKKFLKGEDAISKWVSGAGGELGEEISKTKIDIDKIKEMAEAAGIPLTPAMTSDSHLMRGLESWLTQTPTKFGTLVRKEVEPTYKAFQKAASSVVDEVNEKSASEIGDEIKNTLIDRVRQLYDPASSKYKEIAAIGNKIELTPDMRAKLVKSLEEWGSKNTLSTSEARKAVKDTITALSEDIYMPLTKVSDAASDIGGRVRASFDPKQKVLMGQLQNKIDSFYERSLRRATIEAAANEGEGIEISKQIIKEFKEAKKGWREFRTFMSDIGAEGGLGKVNSISEFIDKIENIDSATLSKNLFDKKNVNSLKFVKESFPDVFEKLRTMEISKLRAASSALDPNGNSIIDIKALVREINKHNDRPEVMKMILGEDKLNTIRNLDYLSKKLPRKFGPSGTPEGNAFQNLLKPALWASDAAGYAIYKYGNLAMNVDQAQTKAITDNIKSFLTSVKKPIVGASTVAITSSTRDYDKRLKDIREIAVNPDEYLRRLDDNTKGLDLDPSLKASVANVGMRAIQLLDQKAPKNPFENSVIKSPIPWKPSDAEMSKFNRYLKAIDDPSSVLQDLQQGMLTPESIESLKTVYPEYYNKLKRIAMDEVTKHKGSLPFTKQLQLGMLLGQPVSTAQDANFVMKLQGTAKAEGAKEAQQAQPKTGKKPGKIDSDILKNQMGQSERIIRSRGE